MGGLGSDGKELVFFSRSSLLDARLRDGLLEVNGKVYPIATTAAESVEIWQKRQEGCGAVPTEAQ